MQQKICSTHLKITCDECGHLNEIPQARLYDGFEGIFTCTKCRQPLDTLHDILDE
ncbi:MAG: hypothetical protein KAH93_03895 [Candidatus Aenigmarchaeota archaeon]|nr:hypothetical protein [Candidatus Aenigmarchaeota archaeon]